MWRATVENGKIMLENTRPFMLDDEGPPEKYPISTDEELIRMKIWAATARKTADMIDDVATAWEIMKIPTELNKLDDDDTGVDKNPT